MMTATVEEKLAITEMARQLRTKAATEKANRCHYSATLLTRAGDLLERQAAPVPVPVSERLPEPEDCDAKGRCWWSGPDPSRPGIMCWDLLTAVITPMGSTHWLPAHALPLPCIESD